MTMTSSCGQTCQLSCIFRESHKIVLPHGLTAKAVKLMEIGYCEQWSVISNKHGFEASTLMVSGQDHTIFYCVRIIIFVHVQTERIKTVNVHELGIGLLITV